MFEAGFLGTKAPLFMDVVTLFFGILPVLVAASIFLAVKGRYKLHFESQLLVFLLALGMVVVFEIGVRMDGGFHAYMQKSSLAYGGAVAYLVIHILFALLTLVAWGITIYSATKAYREEGFGAPYFKQHKKRAKWVFLAICINSIMGIMMYPILFVW